MRDVLMALAPAVHELADDRHAMFTDATNWYIIGGIAMAALGLVLGGLGFRGKNS